MKCKRPSCITEVPPNPYRGREVLYCSKKCKNIEKVNDLRTRRKQKAIDYLGGQCRKCGYNKCQAAMHFHHLKDKSFSICKAMTMTWENIEAELAKCELLCANCHAEHHYMSL